MSLVTRILLLVAGVIMLGLFALSELARGMSDAAPEPRPALAVLNGTAGALLVLWAIAA